MASREGLDSYFIELGVEVSRFLMSKGAKLQDAEDCVQNTFYKMLVRLDSLTEESIRPWFYRVALNDYIDHQRKIKPLSLETNRDSPLTLGGIEALELKEEVLTILSLVKEDYQEILMLKYYYHFSSVEIAEMIGIKPNSVKQKLARARASIKKESERG